MAASSWIPPIPGGKLISKPVRDLGSAVTFLHWCYEAVRRDGTIEFQIHDVAGYLGESYYTVRKWWSLVKDGPWFEDVADRGKRGFAVKMSSDWLEWRAYDKSTNYGQVPDRAFEDSKLTTPVSNTDKTPDQVLDDVQVAVKLSSSSGEVHDPVLETTAYKVLITTDQNMLAVASDDADGAQVEDAISNTPPNRPPRGKSPGAPKPPVPVEVRQAIAKGSGIDLDAGLKEDIQQVNTISRRLWDNYRSEGDTAGTMVLRIRYSGKWIRINQHPYNKNQKQRIPPAAHIKFWPDSQADYDKEQAAANGVHLNGANGHHSDFDYSALPNPYEAQAERQRVAAERRAARKAGTA